MCRAVSRSIASVTPQRCSPSYAGPDFCLLSLFSLFFVCMYVCVCACTCLLCVKMNLVISTSKMTNCHDGLFCSMVVWRRTKKSCSRSLSFHKELPINVTFHLHTYTHFGTMSTTHFASMAISSLRQGGVCVVIYHLVYRSCRVLAFSLSLSLSIYVICRTAISLVDTVTQWDKCHLSLFFLLFLSECASKKK